MAEAATLTFLLNKCDCILQGVVRPFFTEVHEEVKFIRGQLPQIRNFYRVAANMVEMSPALEAFVGKLREVLFSAEEALDELSPRINNGESCFHRFLLNIANSVEETKVHCKNTSKIHHIKLEISSMVDELQKNYDIARLDQGSSSSFTVDRGSRGPLEQALHLEEHEVVGIEKPREKLIQWLREGDSKLKVISICGMGGRGKTTLSKKVYDDTRVKKHFQFHIWITVSESLKIYELLKDMIQQLYTEIKQPVPQEVETMMISKLTAEAKRFLRRSSYILVLDDVWTADAWNTIKSILPKGNGGRVILTTRDAAVASFCSKEFNSECQPHAYIYMMERLSEEDSKKLLFRRVFKKDTCPSHLQNVSESILSKCCGLPYAIVAVSAVLLTRNESLTSEWEVVNNKLRAGLIEYKSLMDILSLSYDKLPYNVKACFLYLSIFPDVHPIGWKRLTRLWVAERFAEGLDSMTAEEVAGGYLNMLVDRNLIQVADKRSDGRVRSCRVHNILHSVSITKSRDQNFAAIAKQHDATCSETVRRLSIHNTLHNTEQMRNISQLHSLFLFGLVHALSKSFLLTSFPNSIGMLNVLDLQGAPLEKFPDGIVKLQHLKYLSLRDTKVEKIPHSIGNLRCLQTLDLKHSRVNKLPITILKLKKLRHLLVYNYEIQPYAHFNYKYGFEAPPKIGDLQSLQKLCFLEANKDSRMILTEIGRLQQLRRLGIIKLRKEDGNALCSSIQRLSELRALSITAFEETEIIDLQCHFSPPIYLQRLYLTGRLERLPSWLLAAESLVKLFLKGSRLQDNPFIHLQRLPNLAHLELLQVFDGETVSFATGGFQNLKILGLDKFNELKSMTVEEGAMPHLEKLIIQRCVELRNIPSGIEHLTKLKVLEFFEMPVELIQTLRDEQGKDPSKVAHIPEVYSTYWRGTGGWEIHHLGRSYEGESSSNPAPVDTDSHELRNCWK